MRTGGSARGAGTGDIKGGDVALIAALRALKANGALESARISVIMTGDEESTGSPMEVARKDLIDLARKSDIALAFEGGSASRCVDPPLTLNAAIVGAGVDATRDCVGAVHVAGKTNIIAARTHQKNPRT